MIGAWIALRAARLWNGAKLYIAIAGAVIAALGIAWLKGRSAGKEAYVRKREAVRARAAETAQEIREDARKDTDAGIDQRLDRWMRD